MAELTHTSDVPKRLADLSRAQPADATLKNLVVALNAKLELCSRLPVFEFEAHREGWTECAVAFRRLAETERRACGEVIDCLREHLAQRSGVSTEAGA